MAEGQLAFWNEWKEKCALGLCGPTAQEALSNVAGRSFRRLLERYRHKSNAGFGGSLQCLSPADSWHLFETHLTIRNNRAGKRYKDWMFERTSSCSDSGRADLIAKGVSMLMRDVVREYLRRELSPAHTVSLHAHGWGGEAGNASLEDLLPAGSDVVGEVEMRELERHAVNHALDIFLSMSQRERVALLARERGVAVTDCATQKTAGCGKTALSDAYRSFHLRLAAQLKAKYKGEDAESLRTLVVLTAREVRSLVVQNASRDRPAVGAL